MGFKDIKAGEKVAKAIAARFVEAKTGTLGLEVAFEFDEPGIGPERLNWVGWLSDKALASTMKTLVDVLDFNGNDLRGPDGVLTDSKAIAYGKEVKLVVEMEPNEDGSKHYPRIRWVNNMGGSAFSGCSVETIDSKLNAVGFKAAFLATKQSQPSNNANGKAKNADGLPF